MTPGAWFDFRGLGVIWRKPPRRRREGAPAPARSHPDRPPPGVRQWRKSLPAGSRSPARAPADRAPPAPCATGAWFARPPWCKPAGGRRAWRVISFANLGSDPLLLHELHDRCEVIAQRRPRPLVKLVKASSDVRPRCHSTWRNAPPSESPELA